MSAALVASGPISAFAAEDTERDSGAAVSPSARTDPAAPKPSAAPAAGPFDLRLGSFRVSPELSVTELHDDNIFATRNTPIDDAITVISPSLRLESDWARHELDFYAGADISRYATNDSENTDDYWAGADGRYDFTDDSNVFGGAEFSHAHEDRASPDEVNGTRPTTFDDIQGYLGTLQSFGPVFVRLGGTAERLDFNDVPALGGVINNDDRDRNVFELGSRVGYWIAPEYAAFVQGTYNLRRYDSRLDDNGFHRDSEGFKMAAGGMADFARDLQGEAYVGYLAQWYDDPLLPDVSVPAFGGRLVWRPTSLTTLDAFLDRSVEETTLAGASSYRESSVGGAIYHWLAPSFLVIVPVGFSGRDFKGIERHDDVTDFGAGVKYFITPNIFLEAAYRFERRNSNVPIADYDDNRFFLRVTGQATPTVAPFFGLTQARGGFYAGAQAGFGVIGTNLTGPRGAGGTLDSDFGNAGATEGIFAGYGMLLDHWYFGLEVEGDHGDVGWDHARLPGGRVFAVDKRASVGGAVRMGRMLRGQTLLYGRVGIVRTDFDTKYVGGMGTDYSQDETETGFRVGGGLEVPASERLFLRLDYTYTMYHDYDVIVGGPGNPRPDNFDSKESLLRLGLGYRLYDVADKPGQEPPPSAADFDGFYVGAAAEHGAVVTENAGPRESGSALIADRANHGAGGSLFGGFGVTLDHVYAGVEVEGEASEARWRITRDPVGRVYSVQKETGYGAGVRLGYILRDIALLYGQVGAVRTTFRTRYELGANKVDQENTLTGLRFGGGMEVAATPDIFLRLDYTHTDYGSYLVDYSSGIDSFNTSEDLLRVGAGYRF